MSNDANLYNVENGANLKASNVATLTDERINQWKNSINQYQLANHKSPIAFNNNEIKSKYPSVTASLKSFTGGNAATGSGLIQTRVEPLIGSSLLGGTFIKAGAMYRPNYNGNGIFNGIRINGGYAVQVCGTASTNEVSTFDSATITPTSRVALIEGCEDVLARNPDPAQAIAEMEMLLEEEKLILSDTLAAAAITSNANVVAVNPTTLPTYGKIHVGMNKMIGSIGKFTVRGQKGKFFMNSEAFAAYLSEQDSQGRFMESAYQFTWANPMTQEVPPAGLAGRHGGYEIWIVGSDSTKGILSSYTVNGSGVITAQTGGTATAIIFVIPMVVPILALGPEYDYITMFDGKNDRQSFLEGEITIGSRTYISAGIFMPTRASYLALTV